MSKPSVLEAAKVVMDEHSDLFKALAKAEELENCTYEEFCTALKVEGLTKWLSTLKKDEGLRVIDYETGKVYIITEIKLCEPSGAV